MEDEERKKAEVTPIPIEGTTDIEDYFEDLFKDFWRKNE